MKYNLSNLNGTKKQILKTDVYGIKNIFRDTEKDITIIHTYNGKKNKYKMYFISDKYLKMDSTYKLCIYKDTLYIVVDEKTIVQSAESISDYIPKFY